MDDIEKTTKKKNTQLTAIGRISGFASGKLRLRQIDLQDTDKSGYFAMTEFNNCFIIRSLVS